MEAVHRYRAVARPPASAPAPDPITTQVVRYALNSAANQMKTALVRTAFSPVIYEVLDFAVGLYDPQLRLLAQAPSLPMFMGTLNFCIDEAVKNVGGVSELYPGDIILYNSPYGTGAHPQDLATVMPIFHRGKDLIGYAAIKAHWLDIGAKDPYCTDTIDVFQEGTVYPGVKIYKRGELNQDIFRMVIANTRVPKMVEGDMNAVRRRSGAASSICITTARARFALTSRRSPMAAMWVAARWTTTASRTRRSPSRWQSKFPDRM
jgi:N-methylhydantoinase B